MRKDPDTGKSVTMTAGFEPGLRGCRDISRRNIGRKGFTLLEIMIAVAVIGGLLVSLIYSLNYHLGIAARHEFMTVASFLAKDKLDDMEREPSPLKGNFPAPYSDYQFMGEVRESAYPGISEIAVTVSRGNESVKFSDLAEIRK